MTVRRLETLPIEICRIFVDFITLPTVKDLSRASKWLREACLPALFRHVEFPFSDAHYHVVSFTYVVPELLKAGNISPPMVDDSLG